jgi:ATP-dependent Clp protease ATP-binding subunit ClpC
MFEKYTEKARRVIFFARYEVSEIGASSIEPEHLLLALLREDQALVARFLPAKAVVEEIRNQILERVVRGAKISTSVQIPLSKESKKVLMSAANESESLGHKHIGLEHLLLGLLSMKQSIAGKVLHENGLRFSEVHRHFASLGDE